VSVEFFSCEGQRIGDKASLDELIHEITKIPLAALRNGSLDQFTTSERRRWADNRRTTEEEDIVYCLLGILGVSMPTTYGEGRKSAQSRLQAEVEAADNVPSIIPFSQNHRFVGRESQLAELEAKLFSNEQTTTILAILGPGGTGKSQLALEIAHRTKQNKKNCSVFWIDASDKDSLYQSYAGVAQKLRVPGWDDNQEDMKQTIKHCVAEMNTRQCMLIFDNADTTLRSGGSSTAEAADLEDFLPQSTLCSVIFTTTNRNIAEALAPQNIVQLQELTPDGAQKMLQTRLSTPLSDTEQHEAEHLLKVLSYLPLAVVQAAACMNARGMTLQEYRLELDRIQSQLDKLEEPAIEHSGDSSEGKKQDSDMRGPVAATLFLSINHIVDDHTLAAGFLWLAACVDRKDISLDLLEAATSQAKEDAIKVLDSYALVTRRPADSALDIHRLVHQALRKQLQAEGWLTQWTQHTITQLLRVFPDGDHRNRSRWRRLLQHVQYALSHNLANDDEERLRLAWRCSTALWSDGRHKESEELEAQVMQISKRVLSDEHPDTLTSMGNLALTYRHQGRWKEAEELGVQVLQITKRVLGDEHPNTLTSMSNLAFTLRSQARYEEALVLMEKCFQSRQKALGEQHPDTQKSFGHLNDWRAELSDTNL
jgi:tetratricopeptide (TPR) repeat protein